ncbi:hypothetical protein HF888_01075 [Bermanella marisrubri]|uniref:Uncharacterized protein n=1 Tax=Bermanella marisrubri TaxID=207949 RepID=Q1N4A2_9GAMM|nr:hypothetical protein [Bermanella marisrubri]EAT12963.1 hypothetical protein RED65_14742 [Oceanobacter sp. RED65] [Bermanella marisrubri]QIZ82909.1 hypothetical protein HF888_01075 [Bermanella marisrubri]
MQHIDDTLLSAYIDNEVDADLAKRIAMAIEEDTEIRSRYLSLKAANEAAKQVFCELDTLPMRDDLTELINNADLNKSPTEAETKDNVVPLFGNRKNQKQVTGGFRYWATAASVFLCALFVYQLVPNQSDIPYPHLTQQLNTELSGTIAEYNEGRSEVVQSWENTRGEFCREIVWHTQVQSQPLTACFNNGQWNWQEIDENTGYQTASDEASVNGVLSEDEERRALQKLAQ